MVLIIPFGVVSGYASVTLAYQLKEAGASVGDVAALIALSVLPHTWKFFWAPVVDVTFSQRKWYLMAALPASAGIAAMGFFPATKAGLGALHVVVFSTSLATTFLGMSVESLMAHGTPMELKGRAGGWFQAGSLGGYGIGGGLGLFLAKWLNSPEIASTTVGMLCLLCALALIAAPTPERPALGTRWISSFPATMKDLWELIRKPAGALALILCFLPIGSGAAPFAAIANDWSASANTVATVTGMLGGLNAAVGCLVGGRICDSMNRKSAYVLFGLLQAASATGMALLPRNQNMFILWASIYTFTNGLTYAAFSAFVLEAIGKGAAATKYNALASLSNIPIYYMNNVDGWTADHWGPSKMLFTEAGLGLAGAVVFAALAKILLGRGKAAAASSAVTGSAGETTPPPSDSQQGR